MEILLDRSLDINQVTQEILSTWPHMLPVICVMKQYQFESKLP